MPIYCKPNPYLNYLSAVAWFCFSFSALAAETTGQTGKQTTASPTAAGQQESAIAIQKAALAQQRASVRKQWKSLRPDDPDLPVDPDGFFELPLHIPASPSAFDCPPVAPLVLNRAIDEASTTYQVPAALISAVVHQESGGYPCAVSPKGAQGLMQLMPDTAEQLGVSDPFDVGQNISGGAHLLSDLMQRYSGDLNRVLGAYNAGPAAVDSTGGSPPFPETLHYIRSVLDQIKPSPVPKLIAPSGR